MSDTDTLRLIIVTGLSGSGKSVAVRQLEDSGYYCVDNLPSNFLTVVVSDLRANGHRLVAVAVDARSQVDFTNTQEQLGNLAAAGWDVRILFLTASTPTLVQRYSETRRRHPLSLRGSEADEVTLSEAIEKERDLLTPIAAVANVLDTSGLLANTLRDWVRDFADADQSLMTLAFESFAFKRGIPIAADLVFDVRNLPNPYYDKTLRPLTGRDDGIIAFFRDCRPAQEMIDDISAFIRKWLPSYRAQNRHYLTVAIGCTGGQHRSVYVAEQLAKRFADVSGVVLRHRQISQAKSYT